MVGDDNDSEKRLLRDSVAHGRKRSKCHMGISTINFAWENLGKLSRGDDIGTKF